MDVAGTPGLNLSQCGAYLGLSVSSVNVTSSITNPTSGPSAYIITFTFPEQVNKILNIEFINGGVATGGASTFGKIVFNSDGTVNNSSSTLNGSPTSAFSNLQIQGQGTPSLTFPMLNNTKPAGVNIKQYIFVVYQLLGGNEDNITGEIDWSTAP